jgi:hypothetical protein
MSLTKSDNLFEVNCDTNISYSIYTSFDEISDLREDWDSFVESVSGDIYLTFDWCRVWWQFYGKKRLLRIAIFYQQQKIVALFPVFIDTIWIGPMWLKLAKIVGTDFTMNIMSPAIRLDLATEIFLCMSTILFSKEGCDAFYYGPASSYHPVMQAIADDASCQNSLKFINIKSLGTYTVFPVADSIDSFFSALGRSARQNIRRRLRKLNDLHHIEFKLTNTPSVFLEFIELHTAQWKLANKLGHFGDWPDSEDFHSAVAKLQAQQNRLRLFSLYADGQPILYRYVYYFGTRFHAFLSARACDTEWNEYGIGYLSHALLMEKAILERIGEIDAGRGHYSHKLHLGGKEIPLVSHLISKKSTNCIFRTYLFYFCSRMLHLLYYRIWFNRLAPKFPLKRKPLWRLWIRTRL